jgi:hypothetical protein
MQKLNTQLEEILGHGVACNVRQDMPPATCNCPRKELKEKIVAAIERYNKEVLGEEINYHPVENVAQARNAKRSEIAQRMEKLL